jgi:hypothetical protein
MLNSAVTCYRTTEQQNSDLESFTTSSFMTRSSGTPKPLGIAQEPIQKQ